MLHSFCIKDQLVDTKFCNMIDAIIRFADNELCKRKGPFPKYDTYASSKDTLRYRMAHPVAISKMSMLNWLADMISAMPSEQLRKKVWGYFDTQTTSYCYSERPCTNQIPGYPYKSKNIVDLLEEIEQVRQERMSAGLSREHYRGE